MTNDFDKLKERYRSIDAPPYLATRVRAQVAGKAFRRRNWVPVGATAVAVVAVIWLAPVITQLSSNDEQPSKPSLSSIASLKPQKPQGVSVSLNSIRTVKRPTLPALCRPTAGAVGTRSRTPHTAQPAPRARGP